MFDDNNGGKALHSVNITRVSLDKVGGDRWIRSVVWLGLWRHSATLKHNRYPVQLDWQRLDRVRDYVTIIAGLFEIPDKEHVNTARHTQTQTLARCLDT